MKPENRELFAHLARAVAKHSKDLSRDGSGPPEGLAKWLEFFTDCATLRQGATTSADPLVVGNGAPMSAALLLTKTDAARELRISVRTLDRLIQSQKLLTVRVEGAVRIRRTDLDAYVAALPRPRSFRDDLEEKSA